MEKDQCVMPEAEDADGKTLDVTGQDFTERHLAVVDKIPLVKPYFKKKHTSRKLDAKCLRALEDPILSTILASDDLVAGDGVFVPRTPAPAAGQQSLMCVAAVSVETQGDMGTDELAGSEQKPSQIASDSQESVVAVAPLVALESDQTWQDLDVNGELFRDKSDEASLDLVFELLMQLQYHTRPDDVPICVEFLGGTCVYGCDCVQHHTALPYHWQIRRANKRVWQSVAEDAQEQLERLYCNPDVHQVRLRYM